jgi:uncharacterized protein YggE
MTAATAAAENAVKQGAVLSALRKLGLPNELLSTADYSVEPQYRYIQNKDPIITGYIVTNTVIAEIHDIKQVGPVIDASLGAGANMISSLDFYSSNISLSRLQAITAGVKKAHAEADAAAKATGGSLGNVVSIDIEGETGSQPIPMYARTMSKSADMAATPISPGQQLLMVKVFTKWQFIPGPSR